jgi:hypothetical protein
MPVGSFPKGKCFYGCYDMAGNAWEWCADWFTSDYYKLKDGSKNPQGPSEEDAEEIDSGGGKKSKGRVQRGGSWNYPSEWCRCSCRSRAYPVYRANACGFRVAVSAREAGGGGRTAEKQRLEEGFVALFNGKDLTGWKIRDNTKPNGWSVQEGLLVNTAPSNNLMTEEVFNDFEFRCEYKVPKQGNSGVYLRGRYEIQIGDDFGRAPMKSISGGICGLIPPSENASKPADEWQTLDVTLVGKKVTVILNDRQVITDGELTRPTIGALDGRVDQPGPIVLQGIFTDVEYRNIRIKPLKR